MKAVPLIENQIVNGFAIYVRRKKNNHWLSMMTKIMNRKNKSMDTQISKEDQELYNEEYHPLEWKEDGRCPECKGVIMKAAAADGPDDYKFIYECRNCGEIWD